VNAEHDALQVEGGILPAPLTDNAYLIERRARVTPRQTKVTARGADTATLQAFDPPSHQCRHLVRHLSRIILRGRLERQPEFQSIPRRKAILTTQEVVPCFSACAVMPRSAAFMHDVQRIELEVLVLVEPSADKVVELEASPA